MFVHNFSERSTELLDEVEIEIVMVCIKKLTVIDDYTRHGKSGSIWCVDEYACQAYT